MTRPLGFNMLTIKDLPDPQNGWYGKRCQELLDLLADHRLLRFPLSSMSYQHLSQFAYEHEDRELVLAINNMLNYMFMKFDEIEVNIMAYHSLYGRKSEAQHV